MEIIKITKMILLPVWDTPCIYKKRVINKKNIRHLLPALRVDQKVVYNTENSGFWLPAPENPGFCARPLRSIGRVSRCFLGPI